MELSIDLTVQATVEEVLETGVLQYEAKGGAAILMDVRTGEIAAMASYPSFDPNDRPNPLADPKAEPGESQMDASVAGRIADVMHMKFVETQYPAVV